MIHRDSIIDLAYPSPPTELCAYSSIYPTDQSYQRRLEDTLNSDSLAQQISEIESIKDNY